ncbi:hypothetical protein [Myxococcus qinghaiensis]|uniref:hypothetical protein n=1 Tax=Myxococcus qinghaiensis TaxID=2906758 RepID=UPI0020A72430|nr:hypothetical protein [Myxococcus qinghaiensis]MCP3165526.1 hypothetical protein [Myxococcus qinghaiensis]
MSSRPFPLLLTITVLLLTLPTVASAGDDTARRKKLVACVNKELTAENKEFKLKDAELKTLTMIVDREVMKEPLKKPSTEEQKATLKRIEGEAKAKLPKVDLKTIDKMMATLEAKAAHCSADVMK